MKDQVIPRCRICSAPRMSAVGWYMLIENSWTDRLKILSWNDALALQCGVHLACGVAHVQQLVAHWMATGSLHYPFASVSESATMQANPGKLAAGEEPEVRGVRVLGELAVHRESLERILVESPQSLSSILAALVSALPKVEEQVQVDNEVPANDGVLELIEV